MMERIFQAVPNPSPGFLKIKWEAEHGGPGL